MSLVLKTSIAYSTACFKELIDKLVTNLMVLVRDSTVT